MAHVWRNVCELYFYWICLLGSVAAAWLVESLSSNPAVPVRFLAGSGILISFLGLRVCPLCSVLCVSVDDPGILLITNSGRPALIFLPNVLVHSLTPPTDLRTGVVSQSQVRSACLRTRGTSDVTRSRRAELWAPRFSCVRIRFGFSVVCGPILMGHWGGRSQGKVSAKSKSVPTDRQLLDTFLDRRSPSPVHLWYTPSGCNLFHASTHMKAE